MEKMIDFRGLTKYLTNDYVRQALFNELKERLHDKRHSCTLEPGSRVRSENRSGRLEILIAKDPATPASVLSRLASSRQQNVLEQVASHSNTHPSTLQSLSKSHHFQVRQEVADNPNTPLDVLLKLACDEHPDVRYRLAENANLPLTILKILVEDENPFVCSRAGTTIENVRRQAKTITSAVA